LTIWAIQKKKRPKSVGANMSRGGVMATAVRLSAVQDWLEQVKGLDKVQAIEGGVKHLSDDDLLTLAEKCEWAELTNDSDLGGGLYPYGLLMGWGDPVEYCQSCGKSDASKVYFINAYA
jgi:hypothetical protein